MANLKTMEFMQVARLMIEAREVGDMGCYEKYFKEIALRTEGSGSIFNQEDPIDFILEETEIGEIPQDIIDGAMALRQNQIKWIREVGLNRIADEWEALNTLS